MARSPLARADTPTVRYARVLAAEVQMTVSRRQHNAEITAEAASDAIEVLPAKGAGKLSIDLRVTATGSLFRIAPARDPHEPRLWCIAVRKCVTGGMVDASEPTWFDRPGQPRADLAEMIETVRDDVYGWLTTTDRRPLYTWLLSALPTPPALSNPASSVSRGPR